MVESSVTTDSTEEPEPSVAFGKFKLTKVSGGVASPACNEGFKLGLFESTSSPFRRSFLKNSMNTGSLKQSVCLRFLQKNYIIDNSFLILKRLTLV